MRAVQRSAVVVGCALAAFGASVVSVTSAGAADTDELAGSRGAWYWARQTTGSTVPVVGAPVPDTPSAASGVRTGEGDLAVAYAGDPEGTPDKFAALAWDLVNVPFGATVDSFTFTIMKQPTQNQADQGGAPIVACLSQAGFAPSEADAFRNAPPYDCANKVVGVRSDDGSSYSFDVTEFAASWVTGDNTGLVLLPDPDARTPFQVVFQPAAAAVAQISYTPPVAATAPPTTVAPQPSPAVPPVGGGTTAGGSGPVTGDSGNVATDPGGLVGGSDVVGVGSGSGTVTVDPQVPVTAPPPAASAAPAPVVAPTPAPVAVSTSRALNAGLSPTLPFYLTILGLVVLLVGSSLVMGARRVAAPTVRASSALDRALRARRRAAAQVATPLP